ncbi:MAG: beta-glucosidase, partial [Verrucomicrobiota bacterium]
MRFTFVSGFKGLTVAWSVTLAAYAAYAQEATLPYETDFEASEGVVTGVASELPEWEFLGDVSTSVSNDSGSGLQALELISAGTAQLNVDGSMMPTIGWFDFLTKPVVVAEEGLPESIQPYQASVTGFVDLSGEGWIYVVDGDGLGGGEWVSVGSAFTLNGQVADSWMRLTYRLDYTNKLWDLYVDGKFVSTDLGFLDDTVDTLNHFRISSDPDDTTGLDFLYAGIDNPLYLDTSNDGLPDSWLIDQGLNTSENQRYSDTDFDGLSALDEFGLGTRADNADTD